MLRWTFHIFAALSLVLMIASCVAWLRSGRSYENAMRGGGPGVFTVGYAGGDFLFGSFGMPFETDDSTVWEFNSDTAWVDFTDWFFDDATSSAYWGVVEIHYFDSIGGGSIWRKYAFVVIRIWFVTSIFGLLPAFWCYSTFRRVRKTRRLRCNLCVSCGYDLRGSPTACPECGHTP